MVVIVLRIAQYHIGLRTSSSAIQTFYRNALRLQTLETLLTYVLSAWLFSQTYLWTTGEATNLEWISYYSGDRARLNERPVFLTAYLMFFGLFHAVVHLFNDNDRLSLGTVRPSGEKDPGPGDGAIKRLGDELPAIFISAWTLPAVALLPTLVVYALFIRSFAWGWAMTLFRPFYNLPRSNMLPVFLPFQWSVLARCVWTGFLLSFIWMLGNSAFSIFLVKEPIKNGKPLTSESKDPNGSLLNGLKSKKSSVKAFAMWELAFIARDFVARRRLIYEDIDRHDGPMWSQVYEICLDVLKSLETRADSHVKAPKAPEPKPDTKPEPEQKRLTQPLKEDNILISAEKEPTFRAVVEKRVGHAAIDPDQQSRLSPVAKKAVADARQKLLALQQELGEAERPSTPFQLYACRFLALPIGWPFRLEFGRRVTAAVLGTPYGEPSLYINAISSLTQLAIQSLTDDKYGNVQRDVAGIIRAFTSVTKKLDTLTREFPMHWTDVTKERSCPEVDAILEALRDGLSQLIASFGSYSRDLRLSQADMRKAKEAAAVPDTPEMQEVQ